jgi:RNA polymerase-associated protein
MTLFSDATCPQSHRVRMVLAEKGITVEIVNVEPGNLPEDLIDLNPYQSVPTLVDRELVLYDPQVVIEYLDERFPHPPLLPVDPVSRSTSRLLMYRVDRDWYRLMDVILEGKKEAAKARKELRESLIATAPVFAAKPFFMSDEFTLVDCCIAPILWRLPSLGVDIRSSKQSKPLLAYMDALFNRESFQESLSEQEREMRL